MGGRDALQTVRWAVGIVLGFVGVALGRGYQLHGWLSGGEWREGYWIGVAMAVVGLCLIWDLFLGKRKR